MLPHECAAVTSLNYKLIGAFALDGNGISQYSEPFGNSQRDQNKIFFHDATFHNDG